MNKKIGFKGLGQSVASLQGQGTGPPFLKPEMNHGTISEGVVLLVAKNIYLATGYDTLVVENVARIPVTLLGATGWGHECPPHVFVSFFILLSSIPLLPQSTSVKVKLFKMSKRKRFVVLRQTVASLQGQGMGHLDSFLARNEPYHNLGGGSSFSFQEH